MHTPGARERRGWSVDMYREQANDATMKSARARALDSHHSCAPLSLSIRPTRPFAPSSQKITPKGILQHPSLGASPSCSHTSATARPCGRWRRCLRLAHPACLTSVPAQRATRRTVRQAPGAHHLTWSSCLWVSSTLTSIWPALPRRPRALLDQATSPDRG